jgi:hypothetical protein
LGSNRTAATIIASGIILCTGLCIIPATASEPCADTSEENDSKSTISVAGVSIELRKPKYRDRKIGFGINAYIAEEFGKAKLFRFLEEDMTIIDRIKSIQEKVWMLREEFKKANLVKISADLKCDVLAYGRIVRMKEGRKRTFAGPANISKKIGEVEIEVCLFFRDTGEVLTATGKGKSSKGIWGFLTEGHSKSLDFDDYMIGQASREAVQEAVKKLIEQCDARIGQRENNEKEIEK